MNNEGKQKVDILFVLPPYHHRNGSGHLFPLGIGSIMACLEEENLTYDYIDCSRIIDTLSEEKLSVLKDYLDKRLQEYDVDLIGIGPCVTPGAKALKTVTECCIQAVGKERVFAGGPFVTLPSQDWFFYDHLGLKYIIKGEGELAICHAIQKIKNGHTMNECSEVSVQGRPVINMIDDLDKLPFPKRMNPESDQFSERRRLENGGITAHIVASRGCPYHCDYCVSGNIKGVPFRKRSANNIIREMLYLQNEFGVNDIVFYDDCFFTATSLVHKEIDEFCSAIKDNNMNMTWQIEIRPDILMSICDDELIRLEKHGCRQMNIGVEKTYPDGAAELGKRYDYNKLCIYLANMRKICKIRTSGTFILGGKNENEETVHDLIIKSTQMNLDDVAYSPLFVYPDTPIYKEIFTNSKEWLEIALNDKIGEVIYENENLSKDRLLQLVNEANKTFFKDTSKIESERVQDRYHLKGRKE